MADPLCESAVRAVVTSGPAGRGGEVEESGKGKAHHLGRRISKHTVESDRKNERGQGRRERKRGERTRERKGKDADG